MNEEPVFDEAVRRWWNDAEFKARVMLAVEQSALLGVTVDRTTAAMVLVVDERGRADMQDRREEITDNAVRASLDLLTLAGWDVRKNETIGQMLGDSGIVMAASGYDPANKRFKRWTAQEPWREVEPRADH